ncbi:MAG: discoidin domain-containing protein [Candidatus Latescibacterota bacterium]
MAIVLAGMAGQTRAEVWEQSAWSSTVYYRATFAAGAGGDGVLHVAAADSYAVYLNGTLVGADSTGTRMASYPVNLVPSTNHLGVRVVNHGQGAGSGLLVLLLGDSLRVETTTNPRVQPWYWTGRPQEGTGWTTADVATQAGWAVVQSGTLDRSGVQGLADTGLVAVAGLPGGIDNGGAAGGLALGRVDGVNLARGLPCNRPEVTDGDLNTSWDPPTNALNYYASVDLQTRRRLHTVRVLTRGRTEADFEANAPRGYSVQVSDDELTWSEAAVTHAAPAHAWSELRFPPVAARYVRVVIVEVDPSTSPRLAEVEVYGSCFRTTGLYTSPVMDLGQPGTLANPGRTTWSAAVPAGTEASVQFRAGVDPADLSDPEAGWGEPVTAGDLWFPAAEPAALWQYRVRLATADERLSPAFQRLRLEWDANLAAARARGRIAPQRVPMGMDTTFTYTLELEFDAGSQGIDRLAIEVPSPARLADGAPVLSLLAGWESTADLLTLRFAAPLGDVAGLEIPVQTRTYAALHAFRAYLFSPQSSNPLNVAESRDTGSQATGLPSWSVAATSSRIPALSAVAANPPAFTPNGDGVNDATVVEFALAKVEIPRPVHVEIRDLAGRLVRRLPVRTLGSGGYSRLDGDGEGRDAPGRWDGTDDAGRTVPPGLYLYSVRVGLDSGEQEHTGVVRVVY